MHVYRNAVLADQGIDTVDVVEMRMREHDGGRAEAARSGERSEARKLSGRSAAGVYKGAYARIVPYDTAACLEAVEGEMFYMYHQKVI